MSQRLIGAVLWAVAALLVFPFTVQARTIYDSCYVTFSPDGQAWTTNAGDQQVENYADDGTDDVSTGIATTLADLKKGEHYYRYKRTGTIPVGKWKVTLGTVSCCHTAYPNGDYHGIAFGRSPCMRIHHSGWEPFCADCGESISRSLYYLSRDAAASLQYLEMGMGWSYYYLCPFCSNLEQGTGQGAHLCKAISANRYLVKYMPNTDDTYGGYMSPSIHIYDNCKEYEGKEVTPQTHLSKNTYTRIGWEFMGWNTRADGTGVSYEDEAEILNLTDQDYQPDGEEGIVLLYAMWRKSESTLELDPAGGTLNGDPGIAAVGKKYGETLDLGEMLPNAPAGYTVSFDTDGGKELLPITGTLHFTEWSMQGDFQGKLDGNVYFYCAPDGHTDRMQAVYERDAIILPETTRDNWSFGGWYADEDCAVPVGEAGDPYVPTEDVILYAKWVELRLYAEENYEVLDGTGAVDLRWSQPDEKDKTYKLYQKQEGGLWEQIYSEDEAAVKLNVAQTFPKSGNTVQYTVAHTGFYNITAGGAQGAGYGGYSGGAGGEVQGKFWLEKGEILTITVGGQDGFNGGGAASRNGNGGGRTEISSDRQGVLIIAGGGGGATENGNGRAGGSEQGLVASGKSDGESGAAGGGGGAVGGRAGELTRHYHVTGVCNHVHSGNSSKYGGCYTRAVICGRKLSAVYTGTYHWYWGGTNTIYCPNCGADATRGETCVGHDTDFYDHLCSVHGNRENNTSSDSPGVCTAIASYALTCGKTTAYTCGYPYNGYIISSRPAYGGSSYVNETAAYSYVLSAGVNTGNGYVRLESTDVGYLAGTALNGVEARDMAAPKGIDAATVVKESVSTDTILVKWEAPQDQGTLYYHQVESYQPGSSTRMLISNITGTTLTSGVKAYLCWADESPVSEEPDDVGFLTEAEIQVRLSERNQYLHLCPVDRAGNKGPVLNVQIGSLTGEKEVAWPLYTGQMYISEGDNVCAAGAEKTYYVRSDGKTEFELSFSAYVDGVATAEYQPEQLIYAVRSEEENGSLGAAAPKAETDGTDVSYSAEQLSFFAEGESVIKGGSYAKVSRSSNRREAEIVRRFYAGRDASGQVLTVYPEVRAYLNGTEVTSEAEADRQNGITVILDGQEPEIDGCEELENLDLLLDRRDGDVELELMATDTLSGVNDFYLQIENRDNGSLQKYFPGEDGAIRVTITEDLPIFSGDLEFTVYASDRVGNETTQTYSTTEFNLETEIARILEPHDPQFKRGESGVLNITTWGYAEKVEVIFPDELVQLNPELNHTYIYELPEIYCREEAFQFMVPLEVPEDAAFTVTVRAYKGDRMMEQHPSFSVLDVAGTVLEDIRTRLR